MTQSKIALDRLPLLRAAAFKNFDVRVVNEETGREEPFDLMKTKAGCLINILYKDPGTNPSTNNNNNNNTQQEETKKEDADPSSMKVGEIKKELQSLHAADRIVQGMEKSDLVALLCDARANKPADAAASAPLHGLKRFNRNDPGVYCFTHIRYIDSPSLAYELHSLAISQYHDMRDDRENQFQRDKILCGNWAYIAVLPEHNGGPNEAGEPAFFWSMVLHYHRYGECLPPCDPNWTENDVMCHDKEQRRIADIMSGKARSGERGGTLGLQSRWMSIIINMQNMIGTATAGKKRDLSEVPKANVEFVAPQIRDLLPKWWVLLNKLWTEPFEKYIESNADTSKLPCQYHLKQSGCQERRTCKFDHKSFVNTVLELKKLHKRPFAEQEEQADNAQVKISAEGQGVEFNPQEFANFEDKEQRQLEIKKKGNEFFSQQDYRTAIKFYDQAIKVNPDAVDAAAIYSNRSVSLLNLSENKKALSDAEKVISLRPTWFRGYSRQGAALLALGRFAEASSAFDQALKCDGIDESSKEVVLELKEECESKLAESKKKTTNNKNNNNDDQKESVDEVTAVLFPADPKRRPYELQIPKDVIENADVIHGILKIPNEHVQSLPAFLARQPPKYPQGFDPKCNHEYTMKDWLKDHEEDILKKNDGTLGYGFQPRELCRGDVNRSNMLCLIDPQSKGPVNRRVSALMTEMDGEMNLVDVDPARAKCRGDALVIRFTPHPKDKDWPYQKNRPLISAQQAQDAIGVRIRETMDRFDKTLQSEYGTIVDLNNAIQKAPLLQANPRVACFVELATVTNDFLRTEKLINFTYRDYDSVWGIFSHIELPHKKNMISSTVLPNTPAYEKQHAQMMQQAMLMLGGQGSIEVEGSPIGAASSGGGGRGGRGAKRGGRR